MRSARRRGSSRSPREAVRRRPSSRRSGLRFDLRVVPPESYGNLLQHFTGSKDHNVALREAAVRRGLSVSEYGVAEVESGEVHAFATEEEVYEFLGYAWIPPELRENCGELEAARNGELPTLVELRRPARRPAHAHDLVGRQEHARGDGRRAQSRRATSTTRSATTRSGCAATCSSGRRRRSTRCSERVPVRILKGIEVNIRADGDARRLRRGARDASTGSSRRCTRASTRTRRGACSRRWRTRTSTASATSPTARSAGATPAPVDVERVIEKALETGTFLEINSQPDRLDLTDVHARAAREAGLKLVIDSDGAPAIGARLRRARRRAGAARVADEGGRRQHAHVEADREDAKEAPVTRAVVFDLWDTLVEWPVAEAEMC